MTNNFIYWRSNTPPITTPDGWMVQSIEDYSLPNISNRMNLRRSQTSVLYIRFPVFLHWSAMHHVSMYFLRKTVFHFLPRKKHVFGKKIASSQIIQERSCAGAVLLGKTIFTEALQKISHFRVFFKKDHHHIFGKKKYHLSWKYKKDHVPAQFFWKDDLFKTTGKRKYGFPWSIRLRILGN